MKRDIFLIAELQFYERIYVYPLYGTVPNTLFLMIAKKSYRTGNSLFLLSTVP